MNKKFWAMLMAVVMIVSGLMVTATAEDLVQHELKHSGYAEVGGKTDGMADATWVGDASYDDYSFWHFVDSSKTSDHADIVFSGGTVENLKPYKNNQHYAVVTPSDWVLISGISYATAAKGQFNLSHSCRHEPEVGYAVATADVSAWHNEITPHAYYERTVDEFYERTADEFYERTVDAYFERAVDEFYTRPVDAYYSRPVTETWQRYAQRYLVPVFTKKLEASYDDTLVSRGGTAFNNGHTFVAVDVAKAREYGVTFGIAYSNKENTPVEYSYTVKINGDKLTVSFDNRLAFASVGAYVFNTIPSKTNAPDHFANTVTVDLPEGYGETVYLYTHLQNLGWYAVDDAGDFVWQFKEWRYVDSRTEYGDYELIDTAYGEYALDDTVYGDYTLADTQYGEYELKDTVYGEYELDHTVYGEYELGHTEYGDYILASEENEDRRVADAYTGKLALTVDGEPADLDAKLTLRPGEHTFVLTGDGIAAKTEKVTVQAGKTAQVNFGTQDCRYADEILDVVEHNADQLATRHEADLTATRHEDDKDTENHFSDCEATRHEADLAAEKHYEDQEAEKIYEDAYLWKPDVKLGSETDANSEYAVKE